MGARLEPPSFSSAGSGWSGMKRPAPACAPVEPNSTCQALGPAPRLRRAPGGDSSAMMRRHPPLPAPPRAVHSRAPSSVHQRLLQIYMCEQRGKVYRREGLRCKKGWGLGARREGARAAKGQTPRRNARPQRVRIAQRRTNTRLLHVGRGATKRPEGEGRL